jgi:2-methylcitrate dehydratase PrpD
MPSSAGEEILNQLCQNVLKTTFSDIDRATLENTRRRVLDMIGCAVGGARGAGSAELARLVRGWGGKRQASILGYGFKVPCQNAAMVNCIFGRTYDRGPLTNIIDGKRFPNHISETTVLTALAFCEYKKISGRELMTAIVVGDDLSARLHIASDRAQPGQAAGPGESGPGASRGTSDNFGAAAIAGRLLGLSLEQLQQAFGITIIMMGGGGSLSRAALAPTPTPGQGASAPMTSKWQGVNDPFFKAEVARGGYEETTSVKLTQGLIAQRGINAALFAQAGWTGIKDAFFGVRGGYYPGVESVNHIERVTADLGRKFHVEQVFKPYPGGRPTHAPTEAALKISAEHRIDPREISEVILHLSPPAAAIHYSKPFMLGDYPTMNALWSYYYAVANALLRHRSDDSCYTEEAVRDSEVQELLRKVKLGDLDKPAGIELEVKMRDGQVFSQYMNMPLGEPAKPMSDDQLRAKFKEQFRFSSLVSEKNIERLLSRLERLEEVENAAELVELAVKD